MKIGIVTIYDAYNYGSFLQAFAMQLFLEKQGHDVYILDARKSLKSIVAQKYLSKSIYRTKLKLKRYIAYSKDWKLLNIVKIFPEIKLDAVIVGSDEVWNIKNPSFEHVEQFYGYKLPKSKIVAYGPSLGYSTLEDYREKEELIDGIKNNFIFWGVRDSFTEDFLYKIGVKSVDLICDPTLLICNEWHGLEKPYEIEEPFVLYYSYMDNTPFKEYILNFARINGLKVYSVGFDYKWCDRQFIVSPLQFLYMMSKAKYVVTSTFHGTVFSTLYKKQFVVIHPAVKVRDYLEKLDLKRESCLDDSFESFSKLLKNPVDYSHVDKEIFLWRNKSIDILSSYLSVYYE